MPVLEVFRSQWTFQDYELDKVQALGADIAEMDDLSLNSWASKFVFILWTLMIKGTAKVFR